MRCRPSGDTPIARRTGHGKQRRLHPWPRPDPTLARGRPAAGDRPPAERAASRRRRRPRRPLPLPKLRPAVQAARLEGAELAAPQLLPARLHHRGPRATHRLSGARRAAHRRALGTPRQRLHAAVRAGRAGSDARDAGRRCRTHHRRHRPAAVAHPAVLCRPGDRAARSQRGRGGRARRDRRQARPQLRHRVHRPRCGRAPGAVRHPRQGQGVHDRLPGLPGRTRRRTRPHRRGGVRHVGGLPRRRGGELPAGRGDRGLVPCGADLHHRASSRCGARKRISTPCPRGSAGPP